MPNLPQEVADGVWRVTLALPGESGLSVNVFVLRDADGRLVLVDTGWPSSEMLDALGSALRSLGGGLDEVAAVAVTHGHPDHSGLAASIQEHAGCALFLHGRDQPFLDGGNRALRQDEWRRFMRRHGMEADAEHFHAHFSSLRPPAGAERPRLDDMPERLDSVDLASIWTPGHSPGHACFLMGDVLFSGDHVLPHITPNVAVHPAAGTWNPLGDYLVSLGRVEDLPVRLVLPAHGEPFTNLRERVGEIREHHRRRMDEVLAALDGGPRTAREVASSVSWKQARFEDLAGFHQRLALGETLAHLRHAVEDGRASMEGAGEQVRFARAG